MIDYLAHYIDNVTPKRIQRKRTKGWRMPEGAVYVGRPSKWGNPWRVIPSRWGRAWSVVSGVVGKNAVYLGDFGSPEAATYWAVQGFRRDLDRDLEPLRGRDLVCWCPPPCGEYVGLGWGPVDDGPYEPCTLPVGHTEPHDPSAVSFCHADVLLELANR